MLTEIYQLFTLFPFKFDLFNEALILRRNVFLNLRKESTSKNLDLFVSFPYNKYANLFILFLFLYFIVFFINLKYKLNYYNFFILQTKYKFFLLYYIIK